MKQFLKKTKRFIMHYWLSISLGMIATPFAIQYAYQDRGRLAFGGEYLVLPATIAQGMLQITDEFQKQTGIADEVVDRIIEHSFRKMELVQAPPEYILLLLPDELKNYCFRCAVNARGMENMRAKEAGANV